MRAAKDARCIFIPPQQNGVGVANGVHAGCQAMLLRGVKQDFCRRMVLGAPGRTGNAFDVPAGGLGLIEYICRQGHQFPDRVL